MNALRSRLEGKLGGLRSKLEARLHGHKNVLPAVGVVAGVVAAYAAVALLNRNSSASSTTASPAAGSASGTDLGYGSGVPAFDLPAVTAVAPGYPTVTSAPPGGGGYDPLITPMPGETPGAQIYPTLPAAPTYPTYPTPTYPTNATPTPTPTQVANPGTVAAKPQPAKKAAVPRAAAPPPAGQSSGPVAPTTHYAAPAPTYSTKPGTVTPVGHAPVAAVKLTVASGLPPASVRAGGSQGKLVAYNTAASTLRMTTSSGQVVSVPHALANLLGAAAANQVSAAQSAATRSAEARAQAGRAQASQAAAAKAAPLSAHQLHLIHLANTKPAPAPKRVIPQLVSHKPAPKPKPAPLVRAPLVLVRGKPVPLW